VSTGAREEIKKKAKFRHARKKTRDPTRHGNGDGGCDIEDFKNAVNSGTSASKVVDIRTGRNQEKESSTQREYGGSRRSPSSLKYPLLNPLYGRSSCRKNPKTNSQDRHDNKQESKKNQCVL